MTHIARTEAGWCLRLDDDDMYQVVSPDGDVLLTVEYQDLLDIGVLFRKSVQSSIGEIQ